jgi:hypothetical protein
VPLPVRLYGIFENMDVKRHGRGQNETKKRAPVYSAEACPPPTCSTIVLADIGMCEQLKDSTADTRNATEKSDEDEKCREDIYCPKGYVCRNQVFGNYWCFNATIARTLVHARLPCRDTP